MSTTTIKATHTASKAIASFDFDFGDTLEELVAICGGDSDMVHKSAIANLKLGPQNAMRNMLDSGKTVEEVSDYMTENWKPGVTISDPKESFLRAFGKMTPEEQAAAIAQLQASAGA